MSEAILLAGAEIEFHTAYARLAETSLHRAELFDLAVQKGLQQIGLFPRSAPEHLGRYRRLLLGHFPSALYYAIDGPRICVQCAFGSKIAAHDPPPPARHLNSAVKSAVPLRRRTHVSHEHFREMINEATVDAKKTLRQLATYSQAPDHPIIPTLPETEYLKGYLFELAPGR